MKRVIAIIIAAVFVIGSLAACGSKDTAGEGSAAKSAGDSDKLQIVTTIFPIYDWVQNILGEEAPHAEVTMLLDNGVDLHSYQPTVEDIMKISTCDLFIYVGGESDAWVSDALKEAVNPDMVVVNLLELLGDSVKEEELKEGMQESEHEHEHAEGEAHEHEEEAEYDEHVWLSLRNAEVLCEKIEQALEEIDPDCADIYQKNLETYSGKLQALDAEYETMISKSPVKTLLFGDRFPFRYLVDDYGLDYYAAFVGCSAETEASFETITFLAGKVDELSLHAVLTIEGGDGRIAETIVKTSTAKDAKVLSLNSMQSVTTKDVQAGSTYLSMMEENLKVLEEALK